MFRFIYIFGERIPTYTIFVIAGVVLSFLVLKFITKKFNSNYSLHHWLWVGLLLSFGIGARFAGYFIFENKSTFHLVGETSVLGGIVAVFILFAVTKQFIKEDIHFDALIPSLLILHIFGKIACFLGGCCYGTLTQLPWAVDSTFTYYPTAHLSVHPTQIYELIAFLVPLVILIWRNNIHYFVAKPNGTLTSLYLTYYGVERFCAEFVRGESTNVIWMLKTTQWIAIGIALVGIISYLIVTKYSQFQNKGDVEHSIAME